MLESELWLIKDDNAQKLDVALEWADKTVPQENFELLISCFDRNDSE